MQISPDGLPIGDPVPGWEPRPRPPATPMTGTWCSLVPIDVEAHAAALFECDAEDRGLRWTYLPAGPFETFDAYRSWMDQQCTGADPMFHTVLDPAGSPIGFASYLRIDPPAGSIEVGYINFTARLQRTPAATEAMYLMMRRVFDELGYRRYEWKCDSLNAPSRRAADRLGFTYEGTFRQATMYKGRNRDTAWYAITDGDWPAQRERFEQWLDPANFDADGHQLQPLARPEPSGS